jgi:hypothetical protein
MQTNGSVICFSKQPKPTRKKDAKEKCTVVEWILIGIPKGDEKMGQTIVLDQTCSCGTEVTIVRPKVSFMKG